MLEDVGNVLQDIKDLEQVAINVQKIANIVIEEDVTLSDVLKDLELPRTINVKNVQKIVISVMLMDVILILAKKDMEIIWQDQEHVKNVQKIALIV